MPRGGKREGAGRPHTGRTVHTVRATDTEWALIKAYAEQVKSGSMSQESELAIAQKRADDLAQKINSYKYTSSGNWEVLKTEKISEGREYREYCEYQVPWDYQDEARELTQIREKYKGNADFDMNSCKIKYRLISARTDGTIKLLYKAGDTIYSEFFTEDGYFLGPEDTKEKYCFAIASGIIWKARYVKGDFYLYKRDHWLPTSFKALD